MFDIRKDVLEAEVRIREYIRETPLDYSIQLSRETSANVYLKCENLQYTGSFKIRGAVNKLLSLTAAMREQGVVTASTGNHGTAVAFGLQQLKMKGEVFVPETTSTAKLDNIRNYTKGLKFYGRDCVETELYALDYAKQQNSIYISPYNDSQVIAGQGTVGLELSKQLDRVDVVFVPVGGGGLIAGIAGYLKSVNPKVKIIGCLPENSSVMAESIKAGRIIEMDSKPTLSDATAGGIEPEAITFALCQRLVDEYITVSEEEIKNAMIHLIRTQRLLVEGASAVALAAFLKTADNYHGKNVVVVLSGGNISLETLKQILASS